MNLIIKLSCFFLLKTCLRPTFGGGMIFVHRVAHQKKGNFSNVKDNADCLDVIKV